MDKEQQAKHNIKCAIFMGLDKFPYYNEMMKTYCTDKSTGKFFDPYNDANDRNKVIEKAGISVDRWWDNHWACFQFNFETSEKDYFIVNLSRDECQNTCIAAVLGVSNE